MKKDSINRGLKMRLISVIASTTWKKKIMTMLAVALLVTMGFTGSVNAQAPRFAATYGVTGAEVIPTFIQQTIDGGYIVAGERYSYGDRDIWVFKLDSAGDVTWQKTYGGRLRWFTDAIQQTTDGGYIVAGETSSFGAGDEDIWILKLDSAGNITWQKAYGGPEGEYVYSIQQTADGGYIVAGLISSFGVAYEDFWILKLDGAGEVTWQKIYGGAGHDTAHSVRQTVDGGYIVAGETDSFGAGSGDFWVLKLGSNGNVIWQKTYGGPGLDHAYSIRQTTDGGYIVAGETDSFGTGVRDIWILKLDSAGNVTWQKTYGGTGPDRANAIRQTMDGGYIVAADANDAAVLKLDSTGNITWQKEYPGGSATSIQQTNDGDYIVTATRLSYRSYLVLKIDENGDIPECSLGELLTTQAIDTTVIGVDSDAILADSNATITATDASPEDTFVLPEYICGPEITVKQGTTDIPNGGSYDFGTMDLGASSSVTFTIENTGPVALTLNGSPMVQIDPGDFSVTQQPSTNTVIPGGSVTFEITFTPGTAGTHTAMVSIANNDADENPYTFGISGEAYELGDMNGDGVFDIFDLMKLINCILDQGSCTHGDLNGDGEYDIFDLMKLINKILAS